MNTGKYRRNLVVLVADKSMDYSIRGILHRHQSLGIKQIDFETYQHPYRDSGCLTEGVDFIRPFSNKFQHALIMLDRDGCGKENLTRIKIEEEIEERLSSSGWGDRAAAIVIDPELENWVWSDSPELDAALGWKGKSPPLRTWLKNKGFITGNSIKASPPKEAVENALRNVNKPLSSSIFSKIAETVSLKRCQDPAFLKLKEKLVQWFAVQ